MNNSYLYFFLIFIGAIIITTDGNAQYYQYKDKNGAIVYTDDLSKIPLDQRDSVKKYSSSDGKKKNTEKEEKVVSSPPPEKTKVYNISPPSGNYDAQREALYKEYELLTNERDQLIKEQAKINSPSKQDAYNKKVNQLNEKIEAFKAKIKEFNIKASQ